MSRMHLRICASLESLQSIKDVALEDAKAIREAWKTIGNRKEAREKIDAILNTHGVEYLGLHKPTGDSFHYCNAGDTYAPTVCFIGLRLVVACWGDYVEKNKIQTPQQF